MNTIAPMTAERLFAPFLDAVDGTLCLPANAIATEISAQAAAHRLRFPLILAADATLREQVDATTHAPASGRFGPYCDNILGINWRLPGGRIARIGERVVKTTTGYDWLRFLLHSGQRYGEPVAYVLRLRPDCGFDLSARFDGDIAALRGCVTGLLHSGWMHWWDAVDFIVERNATSVRVAVHCPPGEAPVFAEQLARISSAAHAQLTLRENASAPCDGLPDLVIKTTPDRAIDLARKLASDTVRCVALVYSGVVHVHFGGDTAGAECVPALMQPHLRELDALGGDWHSRWLPAVPPTAAESRWIDTLERTIHAA